MWLWILLTITLSWYNISFVFKFVTYVHDIKKSVLVIYSIYISNSFQTSDFSSNSFQTSDFSSKSFQTNS